MPALASRSLTVKLRDGCAWELLEVVLGFGDLIFRSVKLRLSGFLPLQKCLHVFNLMTEKKIPRFWHSWVDEVLTFLPELSYWLQLFSVYAKVFDCSCFT